LLNLGISAGNKHTACSVQVARDLTKGWTPQTAPLPENLDAAGQEPVRRGERALVKYLGDRRSSRQAAFLRILLDLCPDRR